MENINIEKKYSQFPTDYQPKHGDTVNIVRLINSNFFHSSYTMEFKDDINLVKEIKFYNKCKELRYFINIMPEEFSAVGLIELDKLGKRLFGNGNYFTLETYMYVGDEYEWFRCANGKCPSIILSFVGKRFNVGDFIELKDDKDNFDLPF